MNGKLIRSFKHLHTERALKSLNVWVLFFVFAKIKGRTDTDEDKYCLLSFIVLSLTQYYNWVAICVGKLVDFSFAQSLISR